MNSDERERFLVEIRLLTLAANLAAAALEELRVRAAVKRAAKEFRHELGAARRLVRR